MIANYHSHTYRCHHATGTEREYVENAIKAGLKILGFSDHAPYIYKDGYVSTFHMLPEDAEGYFRTITDLRDEYKDDIEIHVGVEAEYYPEFFDQTMKFLENFPCEYIIFGQHMLSNEYDEKTYPSAKPSDNPLIFRRYIDQVIEGMNTGKFTYLAHPDLFAYTGDEETYYSYYSELCREALKLDMPLEINLLGIRGKRLYPDKKFWSIAAETGNRIILGTDAHDPESLLDTKAVSDAYNMLENLGVEAIDTLDL